jgi:hypothetical protein
MACFCALVKRDLGVHSLGTAESLPLPLDELPLDELPLDELPLDELPLDELPLDEPPP